jgi:exodeoxyribonuclease VII small subunit
MADVKNMSFEEAMRELETVVGQLERGDVPLEDSIKLYERGAALKARCEAKLKEAEAKISAITLDASVKPTGTKDFDVQIAAGRNCGPDGRGTAWRGACAWR